MQCLLYKVVLDGEGEPGPKRETSPEFLQSLAQAALRQNASLKPPNAASQHYSSNTNNMGENTAPPAAASNGEVPGQPFYDKTRQHLKDLLHKKRILERSLSAQEDSIFRKETEYLEETPSGNIITGFEAYTKGTGPTGGARRRGGVSEGSRVFSRSSISFNPSAVSVCEIRYRSSADDM